MHAFTESRGWMREFANVRLQAARLDTKDDTSIAETLALARRALDLADAIRQYAADAHQRCAALEQAVAASERRAEAVFDMVPVAVISTDTRGKVLHANSHACTLFARGKPVLKRDPLLLYAEDREGFAALLGQLPALTAPIVTTARIRPCNKAPLDVGITIVRDVTDGSRCHWFLQPVVPGLLTNAGCVETTSTFT